MRRPQPEEFAVMAPGLFSICGRQLLGRLVFSTPVLHMLLGLTSASRCSAGLDGCADAVVAVRLGRSGGLRWLRAAKRRGESGDKERRREAGGAVRASSRLLQLFQIMSASFRHLPVSVFLYLSFFLLQQRWYVLSSAVSRADKARRLRMEPFQILA